MILPQALRAGVAELVERTDFVAEDHRHRLPDRRAGPDGGGQARHHHLRLVGVYSEVAVFW